MKEIEIDDRRKLFVFDSPNQLVEHTVEHFIKAGLTAIKERNRFVVALSGGSTPKAFLEALCKKRNALDWTKIYFFWSDERAVAPDHPESNYGMAMQFLKDVPAHFVRMEAEREDREQAARDYESSLLPLDIVYLGMGDDGHTASLFADTKGLSSNKKIAANYIESKKSWRMTFTFPLINSAKEIIILVVGSAKAQVLKEVLIDKAMRFPIERVGTPTCPAQFFCDRAAANLCVF